MTSKRIPVYLKFSSLTQSWSLIRKSDKTLEANKFNDEDDAIEWIDNQNDNFGRNYKLVAAPRSRTAAKGA